MRASFTYFSFSVVSMAKVEVIAPASSSSSLSCGMRKYGPSGTGLSSASAMLPLNPFSPTLTSMTKPRSPRPLEIFSSAAILR